MDRRGVWTQVRSGRGVYGVDRKDERVWRGGGDPENSGMRPSDGLNIHGRRVTDKRAHNPIKVHLSIQISRIEGVGLDSALTKILCQERGPRAHSIQGALDSLRVHINAVQYCPNFNML